MKLATVFAVALLAGPHQIPVGPGESLQVTASGQGRPVVLIPGLFGSAYGFRKVVPLLNEAGFHTIVIEPLGIGGSSRPRGADYSLTAQADRIAAVLDSLHVQDALVVAHSIGASTAFRLAYRHPRAVRAILSLEGGPAETAASPGMRTAMALAPLIGVLGGTGMIQGRLKAQLKASSADPAWVTDEVVRNYAAGARSDLGGWVAAYRAMASAREPEPLLPHLKEITCPVELLNGGRPHDYAVPREEIEELQRSLVSFEMVSVPGAGHYIHEEQPRAVVVALKRLERRAEKMEASRPR